MASKKITRDWIAYIKHRGIANTQSDPKTGKINYKRKVTTDDVINFLQSHTQYNDDAIDSAINQVTGNKPASNLPAVANNNGEQSQAEQPGQTGQSGNQQSSAQGRSQRRKYDPNDPDISDVEDKYSRQRLPAPNQPAQQQQNKQIGNRQQQQLPAPAQQPAQAQQQTSGKKQRTGGKVPGQVSQTPNAQKKRAARARAKAAGNLTEDFEDLPVEELHEKDVETVFDILEKSQGQDSDTSDNSAGQPDTAGKQDPQKVRKEELEQLTDLIADQMSPEQRKMLWDNLQADVVTEARIRRADIKQVFSSVSRTTGSDLNDLYDAWKKAGRPEDTEDIKYVLHKLNFDDNDIESAFAKVLGNDDSQPSDNEDQESNNAMEQHIIKIAKYIKKAGLTQDIIAFMQENYEDELKDAPEEEPKKNMFGRAANYMKGLFGKKATTEDIHNIFVNVIEESRKSKQSVYIGRSKKM